MHTSRVRESDTARRGQSTNITVASVQRGGVASRGFRNKLGTSTLITFAPGARFAPVKFRIQTRLLRTLSTARLLALNYSCTAVYIYIIYIYHTIIIISTIIYHYIGIYYVYILFKIQKIFESWIYIKCIYYELWFGIQIPLLTLVRWRVFSVHF